MSAFTDALGSLIPTASPWWVVVVAGAPSAASAGWVMWKWWVERHDKAEQAELTAEEREGLRLEQERQSLSAGQRELFSTVSAENARLRGELLDTRKDRDRGWTFARRCERRMHDLFHSLMNARQIVDSDREHRKLAPAKWPAEAPLPTDQEISA